MSNLAITDIGPGVEDERGLFSPLESMPIGMKWRLWAALASGSWYDGNTLGELVDELLCERWNLRPSLAGETTGDQRPKQPPGAGRPFDQTFVDVMSPRRRVIAPAGKPEFQCRHGRLLLLGTIPRSPHPLLHRHRRPAVSLPFFSSSSNVTVVCTIIALQVVMADETAASRSKSEGSLKLFGRDATRFSRSMARGHRRFVGEGRHRAVSARDKVRAGLTSSAPSDPGHSHESGPNRGLCGSRFVLRRTRRARRARCQSRSWCHQRG